MRRFHIKAFLAQADSLLIPVMKRVAHHAERWLIGCVLIWFGTLKVVGELSATSIIAKSIYWFEPGVVVPFLGLWEIAIGICLLYKPLLRVAILLLFIRIPGILLAFVYHFNYCFVDGAIWVPTIQGQYLIKDLTLIGAALVIGSTIDEE